MRVMGIDPGTTQSAFVLMDEDGTLAEHNIQSNDYVLGFIQSLAREQGLWLCIEQVASYGMPVGAEVFGTVRWYGRFEQAAAERRCPVVYLTRKRIANHLCGGGEREKGASPNDATVRHALIDRYGGQEAIRKGGRLYGVSKDQWSALAVACAFLDGLR